MGLSISHIVLLLIFYLLIFGSNKVPELMKSLAEGYRAFLDGIQSPKNDASKKNKDDDDHDEESQKEKMTPNEEHLPPPAQDGLSGENFPKK